MNLFYVNSDSAHYALVQWKPTIDVPQRNDKIGVGAPLLRLEARQENIELQYVWCLARGTYDIYKSEIMRRVSRDEFDDALFDEVAKLFSAEGAHDLRELYGPNGAYALRGVSPVVATNDGSESDD